MKKLITLSVVCLTLLFSSVSSAQAAVDPRIKMAATMAGYGVVGGALLGTATLAFGAGGRSIAKGASLGLYAGILFSGYIILNYEMKKRGYSEELKENYYPEEKGQYEDQETYRPMSLDEYRFASLEEKKDPKSDPLVFVNFLNLRF